MQRTASRDTTASGASQRCAVRFPKCIWGHMNMHHNTNTGNGTYPHALQHPLVCVWRIPMFCGVVSVSRSLYEPICIERQHNTACAAHVMHVSAFHLGQNTNVHQHTTCSIHVSITPHKYIIIPAQSRHVSCLTAHAIFAKRHFLTHPRNKK